MSELDEKLSYEKTSGKPFELSKDHAWHLDTTGDLPEDTLLSGKEWYDRFQNELSSIRVSRNELLKMKPTQLEKHVIKSLLSAAKKASGLQD
jgi:hypothetical protein